MTARVSVASRYISYRSCIGHRAEQIEQENQMQNKIVTSAAFALAAAFAGIAPATAGSYAPGCTKEPQSAWKGVDTSAARAVGMGYAISKSKTNGSCHEIYVTKDGKRFELFFNPVTNDLVHTQAKS